MSNETKWEYDYSNIYNKPPVQTTYTNVGSSGTNTANQMADNNYAYTGMPNAPQANANPATTTSAGNAPTTGGNPNTQTPPTAAPTGAVGGMPPPPYQTTQTRAARSAKKKPSLFLKMLGRAVSLVLIAAVGFAGGYVGSHYGKETNTVPTPSVVVQQIERVPSNETASLSTSTAGNDLSIINASALASSSVVVITTEQMVATNGWYGTKAVESGAGSGVIITEDGYILTCAHVISDASNVIVTIGDEDYTASVVGSDDETDIAVIKIEATGLTAATLGDSDALAVGETVIAVGNPLGELGGSVTQGIVSALNRVVVVESYEMTLIQMDASVSPGNSGGGLFNMAGELVGIVNAKSNDTDSEGIGFSIPINSAFSLATTLIESGYITGRPELGIVALSISDAETAAAYGVNALGIYVYSINEDSAAQKAGLEVGDRLISIDDTEISVLADVTEAIDSHMVGDTVTLLVARSGQMITVPVTLGEQGAPVATEPGDNAMPEVEDDSNAQPDSDAPSFPFDFFS